MKSCIRRCIVRSIVTSEVAVIQAFWL
jgi:hypothetical protein